MKPKVAYFAVIMALTKEHRLQRAHSAAITCESSTANINCFADGIDLACDRHRSQLSPPHSPALLQQSASSSKRSRDETIEEEAQVLPAIKGQAMDVKVRL